MLNDDGQQTPGDVDRHLILYDGVCGLCHGLVQAVLQRDRLGLFHFASLQSPAAAEQLARFGAHSNVDTFVLIPNYLGGPSAVLTKASAALFVMAALGWPWKPAATVLSMLPIALLNWKYDLIAANRYRLFGRRKQCLVPRPEYQGRFIDAPGVV